MPLTLSHPAAALPFWPLVRRGLLPLSAFAIGAMSPDFEFFIHLRPRAMWSHSIAGLFTFCLPVGLAFLATWELLARDPTRDLLGLPPDRSPRPWMWWALSIVALLVGAATHLVWDDLTHRGGWGMRVFPSLGRTVMELPRRPLILAVALDYASTVVGGVAILAWLFVRLRRAGALAIFVRSRWRWLVLAALACAALAVGIWNGLRGPAWSDFWSSEFWLARFAVGAMMGLGVALVVFSVGHRMVRKVE